MKEKMSKAGHAQGDMSPHVSDFQRSKDSFAESGFSKTTEYVERQDKHQMMNKKDLTKQAYQGRYS